jgi:glycosyltransferase involved in cell wall biosynthesis
MNILKFIASIPWSGGANRVFLYSRELKRCGHTVIGCCLPGSEVEARLRREGIQVIAIDPKFDTNLFMVRKIRRIIKEHNIDIIDIHSPKFYWIASIAGKLTETPVIITRNVPYRKTGIKKHINRILYYFLVDKVIAISDKIKREFIKDFEINHEKIAVIYDGIDISKFRRIKKESRFILDKIIRIGVISRLDNGKGLECLIDAIPEIANTYPNINVIVVGTGGIEQKLKLQAKSLNIADKVIFTGFKENIPDILSTIDITIMPSPDEGMSMSALESMSCGVPVVATSGGGLVDIIVNMQTGVIVAPNNHKQLAEGTIRLLKSDYRKIGYAASKVIEQKFAIKQVVSQYESLTRKLCQLNDNSQNIDKSNPTNTRLPSEKKPSFAECLQES